MVFTFVFALALSSLVFAADTMPKLPAGLVYPYQVTVAKKGSAVEYKDFSSYENIFVSGADLFAVETAAPAEGAKVYKFKSTKITGETAAAEYSYTVPENFNSLEVALISTGLVLKVVTKTGDVAATKFVLVTAGAQDKPSEATTIYDGDKTHVTYFEEKGFYMFSKADMKSAVFYVPKNGETASFTKTVSYAIPYLDSVIIGKDNALYRLAYNSTFFTDAAVEKPTEKALTLTSSSLDTDEDYIAQYFTDIEGKTIDVDEKYAAPRDVTLAFSYIDKDHFCLPVAQKATKAQNLHLTCAHEAGISPYLFKIEALTADNQALVTPAEHKSGRVLAATAAAIYVAQTVEGKLQLQPTESKVETITIRGKKIIDGTVKFSSPISDRTLKGVKSVFDRNPTYFSLKAADYAVAYEKQAEATGCKEGETKYTFYLLRLNSADAEKQYTLCYAGQINNIAYSDDHALAVVTVGDKHNLVRVKFAETCTVESVLEDTKEMEINSYVPALNYLFYTADDKNYFLNTANTKVHKETGDYSGAPALTGIVFGHATAEGIEQFVAAKDHKFFSDETTKFQDIKPLSSVKVPIAHIETVGALASFAAHMQPESVSYSVKGYKFSVPMYGFVSETLINAIARPRLSPYHYYTIVLDPAKADAMKYTIREYNLDGLKAALEAMTAEQTFMTLPIQLAEVGAQPHYIGLIQGDGIRALLYSQDVRSSGSPVAFIVIIVIVVILLLAGLGFGTFFMIKRRKQMANTPLLSKATE